MQLVTKIKPSTESKMLFNLFAHPTRSVRDQVPVYIPYGFGERRNVPSHRLACDVCGDNQDAADPFRDNPLNPNREANPNTSHAPPDEHRVPNTEALTCDGLREKLDEICALLQGVTARLDNLEEITESEEGSEYESEDSDEDSDDSEDGTDSEGSEDDTGLELGQIVRYEDGGKTRLACIVAIHHDHDPVTYTIKFEDEENAFRDTEDDRISPL
jgi:hypothetical protein